jgi:hypothetical protein
VTIQFVSVERQDRLVADRDPLSHITYFERDDVLVACVRSVGADHVGREHIIERPHTIIVEGSSANAVRRIDIHGADGARTPDHARPRDHRVRVFRLATARRWVGYAFLERSRSFDSGQDPQGWIARRLTEVENNEGPEKLASALRATLEM